MNLKKQIAKIIYDGFERKYEDTILCNDLADKILDVVRKYYGD